MHLSHWLLHKCLRTFLRIVWQSCEKVHLSASTFAWLPMRSSHGLGLKSQAFLSGSAFGHRASFDERVAMASRKEQEPWARPHRSPSSSRHSWQASDPPASWETGWQRPWACKGHNSCGFKLNPSSCACCRVCNRSWQGAAEHHQQPGARTLVGNSFQALGEGRALSPVQGGMLLQHWRRHPTLEADGQRQRGTRTPFSPQQGERKVEVSQQVWCQWTKPRDGGGQQ